MMNLPMLKVECTEFEVVLNCAAVASNSTDPIPHDVRRTCCDQGFNTKSAPLQVWYQCCDALVVNGMAPNRGRDWNSSSYQAYVMGVAVFAILMCLFISGARSIRRRNNAAARRLGAHAGMNNHPGPEFNTQISLGPPTYGELEAGGLTTEYKLGAFNPPPYPGIIEENEEIEEGITINARMEQDKRYPPRSEVGELDEELPPPSLENECVEADLSEQSRGLKEQSPSSADLTPSLNNGMNQEESPRTTREEV